MDMIFAGLALAMWGGTAVKCAPHFNVRQNMDSAMGWIAMLVISMAWPVLDMHGYLKRRTPALAFLQLFLFALPFNFNTHVFDVIAPHPGVGRLAWIINIFQLSMSIRVALLLFTSLGWRLPLHIQMPVQAAKIAMLIVFGTGPYCDSKLLASPEMEAIFSGVHRVLALLGTPLMPLMPASVVIPEGAYARRVAILLLCWLLLGWLLPALLLLPNMSDEGRSRPGRTGSLLVSKLEHLHSAIVVGLRFLLPPTDQQARQTEFPITLIIALRWWVLVQVVWGLCCVSAPLFAPAAHGSVQ